MHRCTKKMGLIGCISHNISNNVARVHLEVLLVIDHELIYQKTSKELEEEDKSIFLSIHKRLNGCFAVQGSSSNNSATTTIFCILLITTHNQNKRTQGYMVITKQIHVIPI